MTDARPQPFPWGAALHFGLARLRLAPEAFWRLTPLELAAMAGAGLASNGPDRARLIELMHAWPDAGPAAAKEK